MARRPNCLDRGALLAQHLTSRPTDDLDFFTAPELGHVPSARDELEAAVRRRGWSVERIQDSDTFCRLIIRSGSAEILIDLAVDAPPDHPGSVTIAGPTFSPEELAGRKVLALFDRLPPGTSSMSTSSPSASPRVCSWPVQPRSTLASTSRFSLT
jgi:hypothetical protein